MLVGNTDGWNVLVGSEEGIAEVVGAIETVGEKEGMSLGSVEGIFEGDKDGNLLGSETEGFIERVGLMVVGPKVDIAVGVLDVCNGVGAGVVGARVGAGVVGAGVVGTSVSSGMSSPDANEDSSKSISETQVVIRERKSCLL